MGEILGREVPGVAAVNEREWAQRLKTEMDRLGFTYDAAAPARLARYHTLLSQWNEHMNLTGDTDFDSAIDRLYLDSLAPLVNEEMFPQGASVIDVGTGAGFPGLPLAIARPDLQVMLLDSLQKRLTFLAAVVEELGLENVKLHHARAEDAGRNPQLREQYDRALARAVAPLPVLCELLLPMVRVGGEMLCYKGPAASDEWQAGEKAAKLLGGGKLEHIPVLLPTQPDWAHCVVRCAKEQKTVRQYPRKAGTPGREPLGGFDKNKSKS
ncbi:MAG: 16S rRNA (guanine(527)-N(7))-methyltransferase RsmG [Clostridiales bacterium]|nr:16S rRNA (guanine(527)-N(7))-methyltransferase RsmG [Clostridiales bacterium]